MKPTRQVEAVMEDEGGLDAAVGQVEVPVELGQGVSVFRH
jgi:hypothetical protein